MIRIIKIANTADQAKAWKIREEVFIKEQKVPEEAEIDEHENACQHFLALSDANEPIGTARWRITSEGVKLERFAVLKDYRGKGVGSALLKKLLDDIAHTQGTTGKRLYLHAQVKSMFLYEKFGFSIIGRKFEECGIEHYKMIKS